MSYWPTSPLKTRRRSSVTLAQVEPDAGRAEDVAGIAEDELDARQHLDRAARSAPSRISCSTASGVLERVERLDAARVARPSALAVLPLGVALGMVARVREQDAHEVAAGGVGVDGATEAALAQQRQPAAVVDVGVAQDHRVDLRGVEGEGRAVALVRRRAALDHAAVEQQAAAAHDEDVAAAGDLTGRRRRTRAALDSPQAIRWPTDASPSVRDSRSRNSLTQALTTRASYRRPAWD